MPALLFTAALASGQPPGETTRMIDPAASTRVRVVQDLAAVVSGAAPFPPPAALRLPGGGGASAVTLRQTGTGLATTSVDTGLNSATLAATAVSARLVMPNLAMARP